MGNDNPRQFRYGGEGYEGAMQNEFGYERVMNLGMKD